MLISERNNENSACCFQGFLELCVRCYAVDVSNKVSPACMLILRYLILLKGFTIVKIYYCTVTKEEIVFETFKVKYLLLLMSECLYIWI